MDSRLNDILLNQNDNYVLPFLQIHGEEKEVLISMVDAIYKTGCRALCVESRPHPDFCGDKWWLDIGIILEACKERNMQVWLFDDMLFPTGYAAGIIEKKYPESRRWSIVENHVDVSGPVCGGSVDISGWLFEETDEMIGVYVCKRDVKTGALSGEIIDITDSCDDDFAYFDLPEGVYRVVICVKTHRGSQERQKYYIDHMCAESTDKLIEAVYETHYEHFNEYFGNTLAGFFSDEPCFGNNQSDPNISMGMPYTFYPWTDELDNVFEDKSSLVYLWLDGPESARIRYKYMNEITNLYKKNFNERLGEWCRAHNVKYIGHIIEDQNSHTKTGRGCGHYFRALDGQDYAGVDVVLQQLIPGLNEVSNAAAIRLKETEPVFYNYTLAKLGSSHAHLQKLKNGRALCEVFGAYGWALSMKTMKWLIDHFIVRGTNYFIPHAFSAKKNDDFDCPPHFYDYGHNPLYIGFTELVGYTNRLCHLLSDSKHISSAAILYHAEAEWTGGVSMPIDVPAKALYDNGIDYDFLPCDYLLSGRVVDNCLVVNEEEYPCIIIPESEYLPFDAICKLDEISKKGVPIIFINNITGKSCENVDVTNMLYDDIIVTTIEKLPSIVKEMYLHDIEFDGNYPLLRTYHSVRNGVNMYFFVNEDIHNEINASVKLCNFTDGEYIVYDAMKNVAVKKECYNGKLSLSLPPSNSVVIITGDNGDEFTLKENVKFSKVLEVDDFSLSIADSDNLDEFKKVENFDMLKNITGRGMMPRFSGYMKYESSFIIYEKQGYMLNLGNVHETASVYINGNEVGKRIIAPYEFDISDYINIGENILTIVVANNQGHKKKDPFSRYLMYEPSGLLGPVELFKY